MNDEVSLQRLLEADQRIAALLVERAKFVQEFRQEVSSGAIQNFDQLSWQVEHLQQVGLAGPTQQAQQSMRRVFECILAEARPLMEPKPLTIACLGPPGTFTHMAARRLYGGLAELQLVSNVRSVFDLVTTRRCRYGVIAIMNTLHGVVGENLDLILEFHDKGCRLCGEYSMLIEHTLMGRGSIENLKTIYSHFQAIGQCRANIDVMKAKYGLHDLAIVQVSSTAEAARIVAADYDMKSAAIVNRVAGEGRNLRALAEHFEDDANNVTRFLVIGLEQTHVVDRAKTSIWVRTEDKPGALVNAIRTLESYDMTFIMSRPVPREAWKHSFFVEFAASADDPQVQAALDEMSRVCLQGFPKVLRILPEEV